MINEAVVTPEIYNGYVQDELKSRADAKANQQSNFSRLRRYVNYGADYVKNTVVSEQDLKALNPEQLTQSLKNLLKLSHRVIYYGPLSQKKAVAALNKNHVKGVKLSAPAEFKRYTPQTPTETVVFVAPYDAKQLYMTMFTNEGKSFDAALHPDVELYNEYFGGSMNAIVFQEMREARSLAYSAWAVLSEPAKWNESYNYVAQIATQNDKLMDAINAFNSIINDMPKSEAAFKVAKDAIESRLRTKRIIDDQIAWAYINAEDKQVAPSLDGNGKNRSAELNLDRETFHALGMMTLDDVVNFQQENVKGRKYYYGILGKIEDLDMDALSKLGKVVVLSTEDIFGY